MLVTARFSGLVTYSDGSKQQFAGHLDDNGNVAVNLASEGIEAIYQVQTDQNWLEGMLALLSGTKTLSPAAATTDKTATSFVAELSGRVAYADGTSGDWIVQYTPESGAFVPSGGSVAHWTAALADSAALANLSQLLLVLAGTRTLSA